MIKNRSAIKTTAFAGINFSLGVILALVCGVLILSAGINPDACDLGMRIFGWICVFGFILGCIMTIWPIYFLPSIIAHTKERKNKKAITVLNILLGMTFLGWVVTLVWALCEDK